MNANDVGAVANAQQDQNYPKLASDANSWQPCRHPSSLSLLVCVCVLYAAPH